jgi:hypothetical protein
MTRSRDVIVALVINPVSLAVAAEMPSRTARRQERQGPI